MNDVTKLPKWAREKIEALERRVENLAVALKAQQQDAPTRVRWGRGIRNRDHAHGFLPDTEDVSFQVSNNPPRCIRVMLTEEGLDVNADSSLQIACKSSNCFTVQEQPR